MDIPGVRIGETGKRAFHFELLGHRFGELFEDVIGFCGGTGSTHDTAGDAPGVGDAGDEVGAPGVITCAEYLDLGLNRADEHGDSFGHGLLLSAAPRINCLLAEMGLSAYSRPNPLHRPLRRHPLPAR